jgi:peptidyl-prolyl cis-trans isomerase SurA
VPTLRKNLEQEGYTLTQFREQLRQQLVLAQLREQEVNQRVQVSNTEAEQYLNAQERNPDLEGLQINLAQILVAVADTATPEERAALQDKAQKLRERAVAGEDFAALARSQSNAPEGADGGVLGLRGVDRYPELFVTATRQLKVGEVSDVLRSDAGWHILKVLQKITPNVPPVSVTQTRARHILLRPGPDRTESQALAELADFKRRVDTGQADFVTLAREHSQDSSADKGGDLDWLNPGSVVAEFEAVLNRLAPGQLGEPFVSRFGVHLLQVLGRRQQTLSSEQRRNDMRTMLLQKKQQEAYLNWLQDLRHQAYVEMREAPR